MFAFCFFFNFCFLLCCALQAAVKEALLLWDGCASSATDDDIATVYLRIFEEVRLWRNDCILALARLLGL
jgi:hypothetical protein